MIVVPCECVWQLVRMYWDLLEEQLTAFYYGGGAPLPVTKAGVTKAG